MTVKSRGTVAAATQSWLAGHDRRSEGTPVLWTIHNFRFYVDLDTAGGDSVCALQRAGRRAGDRGAAIAGLAGVDALIHVPGIVGAVDAQGTSGRGARNVLLGLASCQRQGSEDDDRNSPHGIAPLDSGKAISCEALSRKAPPFPS